MELDLGAIFEITLYANYITTSKLLQSYPQLTTDCNFWQLKCQELFPDKPYFSFWSGEENYLVQCKDEFIMTIRDNHIGPYLYEYDSRFSYTNGIRFTVQAQFIVVKKSTVIGQYNNNDDASKIVGIDDNYYIIDLQYTIPHFSRIGIVRTNIDKLKHGTFRPLTK